MTYEGQLNSILTFLLKDNITVVMVERTKIYERYVAESIPLNDPKSLYEFLRDLEKLNYVDCETIDQRHIFRISGKGYSFIINGGYKNKYLAWIINPENAWKVIIAVLIPIAVYFLKVMKVI